MNLLEESKQYVEKYGKDGIICLACDRHLNKKELTEVLDYLLTQKLKDKFGDVSFVTEDKNHYLSYLYGDRELLNESIEKEYNENLDVPDSLLSKIVDTEPLFSFEDELRNNKEFAMCFMEDKQC